MAGRSHTETFKLYLTLSSKAGSKKKQNPSEGEGVGRALWRSPAHPLPRQNLLEQELKFSLLHKGAAQNLCKPQTAQERKKESHIKDILIGKLTREWKTKALSCEEFSPASAGAELCVLVRPGCSQQLVTRSSCSDK